MYKQWSVDSNPEVMGKRSETSLQQTGEKTSPISVILVSSGSRGNKLLFRYPFQRVSESTSSATCKCHRSCCHTCRFCDRHIFLFLHYSTLFQTHIYQSYNMHKRYRENLCLRHFYDMCFSFKAKQRSPYVLNTSGDSTEDQDGDSRYYAKKLRCTGSV